MMKAEQIRELSTDGNVRPASRNWRKSVSASGSAARPKRWTIRSACG